MEQNNFSAEGAVSKFEKHTLILKFTLKKTINGTSVPFSQKPALRPTASEAMRSEKYFRTQTQG